MHETIGAWALQRSRDHFIASIQAKEAMMASHLDEIIHAAILIAMAFEQGGKLLICGNGGSAADCQHIAAELVSRLSINFERPALPALALTTDTSFLTAFSNDCGYDGVFERQVHAFGRRGDALLGISTSGNSKNVLRAIAAAKEIGMRVVSLTGTKGAMAKEADVSVCVPSDNQQAIQECHLAIEHILCDLIEQRLFSPQKDPASDKKKEVVS